MTDYTGKFKDPENPYTRLYGEVLATRSGLHFVKVTRRNLSPVEPYHTIVAASEFIADSGANKGYWREQLRGKDGRFVEMGGGIEWIDSKGERRLGTVDGFDDEIQRVIVKDSDGNEYRLSADEIKQSAVKAVIPDSDSDAPEEEPEESGIDFDELLTSIDNEPVDIDEFFGDESKFPIGGPPLEIKDKQGNPIAQVRKERGEDGKVSIIFALLATLLPHELSRLFRDLNRSKR